MYGQVCPEALPQHQYHARHYGLTPVAYISSATVLPLPDHAI